ncbi:NAD(P)/FAD-dependent oxidoreductase [Candidatus Woesearchaeota archaeon]|nr:NAD(P)/FAD-dependent oxidoreductase [Candidatus Woesearchaeota archaeon]
MTTVAIIGAGPVGSYLGYLLAKNNIQTTIYEEHSQIGAPIQCTGILTPSITELMKLDNEFVVNRMNNAEIFSENQNLRIRIKDIIVDRTKFDAHIARMAEQAGATIKTAHKFFGIKDGRLLFKKKDDTIETIQTKPDFLIGADGPNSSIAKIINPTAKIKYYIGKQAVIKNNYEKDTFQVYLGNDVAPKFFGWSVPENEDFSRIGVATIEPPSKYFDILLEKIKQKTNFEQKNVISYQGGLIPIYDPKFKVSMYDRINNMQLAIIGDAALHVKATTGGGIIPGMRAAIPLTEHILKKKSYESGLTQINRELKLHLLLRNTLNKFTNKDYDDLLALLKNPRLKEELHKTDRDSSTKLIMKLLIKEPRLLRYGLKIFN